MRRHHFLVNLLKRELLPLAIVVAVAVLGRRTTEYLFRDGTD